MIWAERSIRMVVVASVLLAAFQQTVHWIALAMGGAVGLMIADYVQVLKLRGDVEQERIFRALQNKAALEVIEFCASDTKGAKQEAEHWRKLYQQKLREP